MKPLPTGIKGNFYTFRRINRPELNRRNNCRILDKRPRFQFYGTGAFYLYIKRDKTMHFILNSKSHIPKGTYPECRGRRI